MTAVKGTSLTHPTTEQILAGRNQGTLSACGGRVFEFGAMAESLRHQFPAIPAYKTRSYQKFADAIVLLAVHGVLTEKERDAARLRIMRKMIRDLREAGEL